VPDCEGAEIGRSSSDNCSARRASLAMNGSNTHGVPLEGGLAVLRVLEAQIAI
jgi:hypothetical protein